MQTYLMVTASAITCWAIYEVIRRSSNQFAWLSFWVAPLILTPHWIAINPFGLFEWAKLYSVLIGACWTVSLRSTAKPISARCGRALNLIVGINILEAVSVDALRAEFASTINAISGILLIAKLPRDPKVNVPADRKTDLEFHGLNKIWIIQYTLWNLVFLYNNYPQIFGHHLAVAGVPLVVGLINPKLWLQARVYTLAVDLILLATFWQTLAPYLDTTSLQSEMLKPIFASLPLILWLVIPLLNVRSRHSQNDETLRSFAV